MGCSAQYDEDGCDSEVEETMEVNRYCFANKPKENPLLARKGRIQDSTFTGSSSGPLSEENKSLDHHTQQHRPPT